jgi:hypothetical protein
MNLGKAVPHQHLLRSPILPHLHRRFRQNNYLTIRRQRSLLLFRHDQTPASSACWINGVS